MEEKIRAGAGTLDSSDQTSSWNRTRNPPQSKPFRFKCIVSLREPRQNRGVSEPPTGRHIRVFASANHPEAWRGFRKDHVHAQDLRQWKPCKCQVPEDEEGHMAKRCPLVRKCKPTKEEREKYKSIKILI